MALTLRTLKGSRLTHKELDDNFRHFTGSHTVDGTVTATAFVGDGSGLTNLPGASLTGTGILSGSIQIAELGAGIVSGSSQLDGEVFGFGADIVATGSFTGSFVGDGSNLTGVVKGAGMSYNTTTEHWNVSKAINLNNSIYVAPVGVTLNGMHTQFDNGNFYNPIRFNASELRFFVQGSDDWFQDATMFIKGGLGHISASLFSGSFYGDGSNLTGITPDLTGTTVISGSGLEYNSAQTRWDFSKAIVNSEGSYFGQKLMVYANNYLLNNEGAKWLNTNIGHQDVAMKFYTLGSNNNDIEINVVQGHISASAFSGSFSGSFYGDGSNLTGITPSLTGTGIVSGSNWSYTPNNTLEGWKFDGAFQMSDTIMNFGVNAPTGFGNLYFGTPGGATGITSQTDIGFTKSKLQFYSDHNNVVWDQDQIIEIDGTSGAISASYFTGSFVGDGSQLTGLPAGNVPVVTSLAAAGVAVSGSFALFEPVPGAGLGLFLYTGQASNTGVQAGWQNISLV